MKINWTKVIGVVGTACGLVATFASDYSSKKEMKETVSKEVAKALENQNVNK